MNVVALFCHHTINLFIVFNLPSFINHFVFLQQKFFSVAMLYCNILLIEIDACQHVIVINNAKFYIYVNNQSVIFLPRNIKKKQKNKKQKKQALNSEQN